MDTIHRALGAHRATAAPLLALLLGVRREPDHRDGPTFSARSQWGPLGISELSTLADMALGGAIRLGAGHFGLISTVTLTLALDRVCDESEVSIAAQAQPLAGHAAGALARLWTPAGSLGRAIASFTLPQRAQPADPLPWEQDAAPDVAEPSAAELDDRERALADALRAPGSEGLEARVLEARTARRDGTATLELDPGLALLNRAGNVQGGAIAGIAAAAAAALVDEPRRLAEIHVQYLAPVAVAPLTATAELVRGGRTMTFAGVTLTQGGGPLARAAVTLTRVEDPDD